MLFWLLLTASATEVPVFLDVVPPGARMVLGESARELEEQTGVKLTRWVWVDEAALPPGARVASLPAPVPPPFERHDYDPPTPAFEQDWLAPAPAGLGAQKLWAWPGGTGANVVIADVEYDYDPFHEDLRGNLPTSVAGERLNAFDYHGNGSLGIAAASRDGFGTSGAAPDATLLVAHPIYGGQWIPARAIADVAVMLAPGDVLLIEQQSAPDGQFAPLSANPMSADAMEAAVLLGLVVVEPMGNGGRDVGPLALRDLGTLRVGGGEPITGSAHLSSNFGSEADVSGWAAAIPAPTTADFSPDLFYPDSDTLQAYTSSFGGTSGASAQVAGVVAQLQSIATELYGEPLSNHIIRAGLRETGVPQADGFTSAQDRPVGPGVDAQAFARTFLVP